MSQDQATPLSFQMSVFPLLCGNMLFPSVETSDPSISRRNNFIVSDDTNVSGCWAILQEQRGPGGQEKAATLSVTLCPLAAWLPLPIHPQTAVAGPGQLDVCLIETSIFKGKIYCYFLKIKLLFRLLQVRFLQNSCCLLKKKIKIKLFIMSAHQILARFISVSS